MKGKFHKVFDYIFKLESKIAFYPTLISFAGFLFAFFMYYIENLDVSKYLVENVPWLVINNVDTARIILTTFVAGLISIMVFSFSMVMILLSQASSNFSPRVLPGLISNRRHQIILGIYNSCLLYCIFTLIAIEPTGDKYQLPGFSVLLAIVFMTLCLGAFIYFIHSISQEIQINNIMSAIFNKAKGRLNSLIESEQNTSSKFPDASNWHVITSPTSGYLEDISLLTLYNEISKHDIKASILVYKGDYIFKGIPLLKIEKQLNEERTNVLLSAFDYSKSELIEDNYILAFKQTAEITVKAMSPGINDPGTAVNAIDYLTELFLLRMQKQDSSYYYNPSGTAWIYIKSVDFKTLLYTVMASLRTYCKHDVIIVQKLFGMLNHLLNCSDTVNDSYKEHVKVEIKSLYQDATNTIENTNDLALIKASIDAFEA